MTLTAPLQNHLEMLNQHERCRPLLGIAIVIALHLIVLYALIASRVIPAVPPRPESTITFIPEPTPLVRPVVEATNSDIAVSNTIRNVHIVAVPLPDIAIAVPVEQVPSVTSNPVAKSALPDNSNATSTVPDVTSVPTTVGVACPNWKTASANIPYPLQARRAGLEGEVTVQFTVGTDGSIINPTIVNSSNRVFNNVSLNAIRQFRCAAQSQPVQVETAISFKLAN